MCGIAGAFSFSGNISASEISQMVTSLSHRGPDFQHTQQVNQSVVLGHARLSIVDITETANQPFRDTSGLWTIVFNGEIYNYKELKSELSNLGVKFKSLSDTEVLLECYKHWGNDCFSKFNGMFALAIYDHESHELTIARDRFGKKPLYYYFDNEKVIFASELTALLKFKDCRNLKLSLPAIRQFLTLNYTTNSFPIIDGITSLEPATILSFRKCGFLEKFEYWKYETFFANKISEHKVKNSIEEIHWLIKDSCKIRLRSDVPVCQFLSGGIDSSIIAACFDESDNSIEAYTAAFDDSEFDESQRAMDVADFFSHSINTVQTEHNIKDTLTKMIKNLDSPIADTSLLPLSHLCATASNKYKVGITGDGGDEIFAGYETYFADQLLQRLKWIPKSVFNFTHQALNLAMSPSFKKVGIDEKARRFFYGASFDYQRAHLNWRAIFTNEELIFLLQPDFHYLINDFDPFLHYSNLYNKVRELEVLDQSLFVDSKTWLLDDILVKADRISMINSMELRSPFLDYRLAEKLAPLPVKNKITFFQRKKLLKDYLNDRFPSNPSEKAKRGFNSPVNNWLSIFMYDTLEMLIRDKNWGLFFNMNYLTQLILLNKTGKRDCSLQLYGIAVLYLWLQDRNVNF